MGAQRFGGWMRRVTPTGAVGEYARIRAANKAQLLTFFQENCAMECRIWAGMAGKLMGAGRSNRRFVYDYPPPHCLLTGQATQIVAQISSNNLLRCRR